MEKGFDNEKYLEIQAKNILKRMKMFDNKLYLEFGGKLFDDYHAARVLPGFEVDSKIKMLSSISDKVEYIIAISSEDIESSKVRNDLEITYENDVLLLISKFKDYGITTGSIVVTKFENQPNAVRFIKKLKNLGIKVYKAYPIKNYPYDTDLILSEEGFGKNDYIETTKPVVVVTGPGPGSGKLATCLSQLYNESKHGVKAGYAKYETFPIWNLSLQHEVNKAYEAATVDLADVNMIDQYHLDSYGVVAVNYNRDIEGFPILQKIFSKLYKKCPYKSPTDMGVNMIGSAIINDEVCKQAAREEIIRRYYETYVNIKLGKFNEEAGNKINTIVEQLSLKPEERIPVQAALEKKQKNKCDAVAIKLNDGRIIRGRNGNLLSASAACILNALKVTCQIEKKVYVLSPNIFSPILELKKKKFGSKNPILSIEEVLLILSVSSMTNPICDLLLKNLDALEGTEAHSTTILKQEEIKIFKKLGINITCEPVFSLDTF